MADRDSMREAALSKIAGILEDQMVELSLTEEEKNEKTAELAAYVSDAVTSKLGPRARRPGQPQTVALQA
jgi:hypothetical protein